MNKIYLDENDQNNYNDESDNYDESDYNNDTIYESDSDNYNNDDKKRRNNFKIIMLTITSTILIRFILRFSHNYFL